jgi:hypothetical protein
LTSSSRMGIFQTLFHIHSNGTNKVIETQGIFCYSFPCLPITSRAQQLLWPATSLLCNPSAPSCARHSTLFSGPSIPPPLCFHTLTNSFSRNPFRLILLRKLRVPYPCNRFNGKRHEPPNPPIYSSISRPARPKTNLSPPPAPVSHSETARLFGLLRLAAKPSFLPRLLPRPSTFVLFFHEAFLYPEFYCPRTPQIGRAHV